MMVDVWNKITTFLDHYRWTVICLAVFVVTMVTMGTFVGCESTTTSVLNPPAKVTRTELTHEAVKAEGDFSKKAAQIALLTTEYNVEVAAFNKNIESANADLDQKDAFRAEVLNAVSLVATNAASGTLNPAALIPMGIGLLGMLLGIGASADNRRKDTVITTLKVAASNPSAVATGATA